MRWLSQHRSLGARRLAGAGEFAERLQMLWRWRIGRRAQAFADGQQPGVDGVSLG